MKYMIIMMILTRLMIIKARIAMNKLRMIQKVKEIARVIRAINFRFRIRVME